MTDLVTTTAMTDDVVDDPSVDEDQLSMNDDSFDLDLDSIMNDNTSLSGVPEEEQDDPVLDDILDDDDEEPDIEPMIDEIDDYNDEPALVDDDDDMMISSRIEEEESITPIKEEVEPAAAVTESKKKTSSKKKKTSSKKQKKKSSTKTPTKKKKGGSSADPLHRLYATQTSATKHQNYKRAKEYEKSKVKEAPIWGVDEKALKKAKQLIKASNTNRPLSRAIEYSIEKASAKQRNAIEKKKNKAKAQILDIWGVDDKALRKASNLKTKYGNIPPSEYLRQTTNAAHHQEWLVYKELEKARRKKIKFRGVDERNIEYDDQMSAPVYTNNSNNNKYNYSSLGNMSISSNVSNRKRRPDMIPGYFSSSHSYSDYYYSGAKGRRKRASSSKPFHDRRSSSSIPRDITPKIVGSSSKHTNFLKKYGKTSNSTKSRNTRTTAASSSSAAVHANIRDVIIKDMDAQSVLTHDESENQSWIGENSYYNDDEMNDPSNDDQKKEPPEKKTTPAKKTPEKKIVLEKKNTSEKKITPKKAKKTATPKKQKKSDEKAVVPAATNPEDVKMAKESLKKVASPIKTERKKAPEPALPTPKKKEKKALLLQQDGPSMAPKRASDPHFAALQDKLQEEEKKVLEETKTLNKMQRLKKQTLQLFDKDKKKYSIRDILAKAPKKTRLKRGKSIQFWKKRKDLDDNKSKSKLLNISESIQEDDNSDSSDEE